MAKLFFVLLFIINILAIDSKISKLKTDDTLASWERKAILFTKDTGLNRNISLNITYCHPIGKKKLCFDKGDYDFKISNLLKSNFDGILWSSLIKNRYDKIFFKKNGIDITTPTKTIYSKNKKLAKPSLNHSNINAYENSVNSFLDKIKKPILGVLKESIDQRYLEMDNKEKGSFWTTKAKSSGIPVEIISSLMNSSFAFSIYSSKIQGSITINKFIPKKRPSYYETTISISNKSTLFISKLNTKQDPIKFNKYKNIEIGTSHLSHKTSDYYPSNDSLLESIVSNINSLYKDMATKYAYELVKDDNFAIINPVNFIKNDTVYSSVGVLEDIRIDAPYIIRKTVNGKVKETGFVKNRTVFDNSYKNGKQQIGDSGFDIIQGSADIISQIKEHPWNGTFFSIGGGVFPFKTDNTFFKTKEVKALHLGGTIDLGYKLNAPILSEVWFLASSMIGISKNGIKNKNENENIIIATANFALSKRYYLKGSGLYFAPAVGFGGSFSSTKHTFLGNIKIGSVDFHTSSEIGLNMGANNEFSFYVDYDIPIYTFMQTDYIDFINDDGFVKRGLSIGFVYKKHI